MKIDDHNHQLNNITIREEEIYSSEDQIYDYLSIQGFNTRFGLDGKNFDIFIIKELMDNALDFIEQNAKEFVNGKFPFVDVIITENGEVIKIRFKNSNAGINNIFTDERINKIFNLEGYYSSKKYRHKITRGELGDAFKAILCIPYAIAINNNNDDKSNNNRYQNWKYPLEINVSNKSNNNRSIKIWIDNIDKIRRKEKVYVKKEYNNNNNKPILKEETNDNNNNNNNQFTEIAVYLPKIAVNYSNILDLLKKYAVLNTHIDFNFKLPSQQKSEFYLATQKLKTDWKNKESINFYSLSDWENLIFSFDKSNDNLNVYDNFIHTNIREGWTLTRDEDFKTLTYGNLKNDSKKIEETYQKLKDNKNINPIKEKSTSQKHLDVPFDMNKKTREEALKKRLKDVYKIEDNSFSCKRFDEYSSSTSSSNSNGVIFPYMLEIVIATSPILDEKLLILIESLNCSPSLHSDSLFSANERIFIWETKDKTKKWRGNSVAGILEDCGYSMENEKEHAKPNNLIIINLISPRIDYRSHSKSNIELKPFAPTIAQDIYNFCRSASPRNKNKNDGSGGNERTMIFHLRNLLIRRYYDVKNNPDLIKTDRWNQSTIFYRLRPILIEKGIPINRKSITGAIDRVCKNDLPKKCKRHEIGIITAARAQLYFNGKSHGVSIDEISNLIELGTDLVIIEKEGAVEVLGPFADKYGIALLYTRGFLTEYALELSEKSGSNIVILTDFDASGLLLASKLPGNIHRIGIDFQTLEDLDIDIESVQEKYEPKEGGHYDALKTIAKNNSIYPILEESLRYLRHYRIEIDSILAELNNNERFWDFILDKLVDIFPNRNYNRSIDVKESIMPEKLEEFITNITDLIAQIQEAERQKIMEELENTVGFIDNIVIKKEEIENRLRSVIEKDNHELKKILSEFEELNTKYFNK